MDFSAWVSITALILVIPLGVASNLLTYRFSSFLERRKLIKTHKTRQQALQGYERIKAFHEGRRDKYPYYMLLMGTAVLLCIVAATIVIVAAVVSPPFEIILIWCGFAVIFVMMSIVLLAGLYWTARQLERFDDYKKEFEKQWGPIDA
jgi:ABC-type transport system involved in cytochrome bd biosynthesis fused ATPase/permease subunit